jgi:hypothetical protein
MDVAVANHDFDDAGFPAAAVDADRAAVVEAVQVAVLSGHCPWVGEGRSSVDACHEASTQHVVVAVPEEIVVELTGQ